MDVVDALAHRGRFFRVLQQTARSQTAVMTIDPGADAGPEEERDGATYSEADEEHRAD